MDDQAPTMTASAPETEAAKPLQYRKLPVVIDAVRFTGENFMALALWAGGSTINKWGSDPTDTIGIESREGRMLANKGDWIIRGIAGEFYPCKPEIFEATYEAASGTLFGFGRAIKELQNGARVTRDGWNGKGMWLYYVPANSYAAQTDAAKVAFGDTVPYRAYIAMKTAQDDVVPWVASQSDLLADDWYVA